MSTQENTPQRNENPNNYIYQPGVKVEIEGALLSNLIGFANRMIDDNTELYFTDRFKYINKETDKEVKNAKEKDIQEGKVVKIVDIEKTMQSEPKFYRNELALEAIKINLKLNNVHIKSIKDGKAVHYEDLQNKVSDPKLEKVES